MAVNRTTEHIHEQGSGNIGATLSANMVLLGDKLDHYKAMAKAYPHPPSSASITIRSRS